MATLLLEERFLCSICLEVFTEPLSTPCGHNFCRSCIHKYWDSSDVCQCPFCKRTFSSRPELHVNTTMSELVADFAKMVRLKVSAPHPGLPERGSILCDICTEVQERAVKSCLMCLTSFCEVHLEPHRRVSVLKSHRLIDPVSNLDDRMCKTHNKMTELYCRTDEACICVLCFKTSHKSHNVISLEEEYEAVIVKNDDVMENIQKMIEARCDKIGEIENSVDASRKEADEERDASVQVFTDVIRSIRKSQADLVEVIEERHRAMKQKAEGFLKELRVEVAELKSRRSQLEKMSQSEDHHGLVQNFSSLCSPSVKDWTNADVHSDLSFSEVRRAVAQVTQTADAILEKFPDVKMKRMREHAVDLTLDPDTAHCSLAISRDRKQVAAAETQNLPKNSKRFEMYPGVLAKEGFTGGRFYFEVQVKDKSKWAAGVVRQSVDRKRNAKQSVSNGFWTISFNGGIYLASENLAVSVALKEKLKNVGIFVDYDRGAVSFYDVDSLFCVYAFSGCHFKEKLYPYFCTHESRNEKNSDPLIITPVPHTI